MFSELTRQLRDEIATIKSVLATNERVRSMIFDSKAAAQTSGAAPIEQKEAPRQSGMSECCIDEFIRSLEPEIPTKLEWQIYDHCAAFTRLYAAYEHFINELVHNFVAILPDLYTKYDSLPEVVSIQHRIGIGQILLKIGSKGSYKELEEATIIRTLSRGLSGELGYSLIPDAFLVDRQNYRFEVLVKLFASLGFDQCSRSIARHPDMTSFMRAARGESGTVSGELDSFIKYRNEAAHDTVDNIVAPDEIGKIADFVVVLCGVLADMLEVGVLRRRMDLGHYSTLGTVNEVHYGGFVVVAQMRKGSLEVGDEVIIFDKRTCARTEVLSIQTDNVDRQTLEFEDGKELGVRLSTQGHRGCELRRLTIPAAAPEPLQLTIEEALPTLQDEVSAELEAAEPEESLLERSEQGETPEQT